MKVHKLLRHAHIARLFEVISSQASINLCMQHAGGGTLRERCGRTAVLVAEQREEREQRAAAFFAAHRVLLLHAGGESRRLPCYVPEGKLFAPLALPSPDAIATSPLDVTHATPHTRDTDPPPEPPAAPPAPATPNCRRAFR